VVSGPWTRLVVFSNPRSFALANKPTAVGIPDPNKRTREGEDKGREGKGREGTERDGKGTE
jgi:hypothetical protein